MKRTHPGIDPETAPAPKASPEPLGEAERRDVPTIESIMEAINETPRIGHLLATDKLDLAARILRLCFPNRCIECGGKGKVLDLDDLDAKWIPCSTCAATDRREPGEGSDNAK